MSDLVYQRDSKKPVYISTGVYRALWIMAKRWDITPDEQADGLLRKLLEEKYPQLFEHQKQIAKLEKELINTLQ